MADKLSPIDAAARVSHRHLIFVVGFILLLGMAALSQFGTPDLAMAGHMLWLVMPIVIITLIGIMVSMQKSVDKNSMKAAHNDELRQVSLQGAWRNGFFVALTLQPLLALVLTFGSFKNEVAIMAVFTVIASSVTVLGSLIWYDR